MSTKPLVSFVLISFKQERFIRESVRSALAQTYEPMEIILSDDCSPDRTFEYMASEAEAYKGPHRIRLNRNEGNLGLVGNLERAVRLSEGELIVVQAGDDLSHPRRTEMLAKAWADSNSVDLVCSDVCLIDEHGATTRDGWYGPIAAPLSVDEAIAAGHCYALGCAAGYSRSLFEDFPPMSDSVFQEDNVLMFRALLRRGVRTVPDRLVQYRQHSSNIFLSSTAALSRNYDVKYVKNRLGIARDRLRAWEGCRQPNDSRREELVRQERYWWYRAACIESGLMRTCSLAIKGLADGLTMRNALGLIKLNVLLNWRRLKSGQVAVN